MLEKYSTQAAINSSYTAERVTMGINGYAEMSGKCWLQEFSIEAVKQARIGIIRQVKPYSGRL